MKNILKQLDTAIEALELIVESPSIGGHECQQYTLALNSLRKNRKDAQNDIHAIEGELIELGFELPKEYYNTNYRNKIN